MPDSTYKVTVSVRDFSGDDNARRTVERVYGGPDATTAGARAVADFPADMRAELVSAERTGPTAVWTPGDPRNRDMRRIRRNEDVQRPVRWDVGDGAYLFPAGADKPVPVRVVAQLTGRGGGTNLFVIVQPTVNRGRFYTHRLYAASVDGGRVSTELFARNRIKRSGAAVLHTHDASGLPVLDTSSLGFLER